MARSAAEGHRPRDVLRGFAGFVGFGCRGRIADGEEGKQLAILLAGIFIEQPEHDLAELRSGVFLEMFQCERPGDDLAAGIVPAQLIPLRGEGET